MSKEDGRPVETRKGMFCCQCGEYAIRRVGLWDSTGTFACEACGWQFEKTVLPLFIVTGASGAGKSAIIEPLQRLLVECGVFDKDLMWADDWDMVANNFFRVTSALAQGGRKTVIVGTIVPAHLEGLSDRCLVGEIYYANLHTDDHTRRARLLSRRKWGVPDEAFIQAHERFAAQLLADAASGFGDPMPTFDTTHLPPDQVAALVAEWVRER